jgi:hypothetical protein
MAIAPKKKHLKAYVTLNSAAYYWTPPYFAHDDGKLGRNI